MADENQKLVNKNGTNIVIIDSRDSNTRAGAVEGHLSNRQSNQYSKIQSGDSKTAFEKSDLEESMEKAYKSPADILPGLMLDVFKRTESYQPGSKFNVDATSRKNFSKRV